MKRKMKRFISFVMTFVLALGMFSSVASAEITAETGGKKINGVYAEKTASYDEKEGKVTITLSIQGDKVDVITKQKADVVLVVDNSGSMKLCGGTSFTRNWLGQYTCDSCGATYFRNCPESCDAKLDYDDTKIATAIASSNAFADSILTSTSDNRLAVIGFSSNSDRGGADDSGSVKVSSNFVGYSGLSSVKSTINRMKADGGTNYSAALYKAQQLIASRDDTSRPAYVVFMSDGAPGRTGTSKDDTKWNGADQVKALKSSGVVVYTIGINLTDEAGTYLKSLATSDDNYFNVTNDNYKTELGKILSAIAEKINQVPAGSNAIMLDIVNDDLFENIDIEGTGLEMDEDGNVVWNIGDIPAERREVSFTVEPKDGVYGDALKTNKNVILTYKSAQGSDVERDKTTIGDPEITIPSYTVTWVDGDDKIIYKDTYLYGEMPIYDSEAHGTPQKTPTAQYSYTFTGWNPTIVPVTEDATYTAQFDSKENEYTVTWINGDGNVIYSQDYIYGQTPVYDEDGHGVPQKTPTAQYTYTFNGKWDPAIVPVTEDATYTAQFDSKENEYTVTWVNGDGNVIYSQDYTYGQTPVYDEDGHGVPQKTPTAQYTYTFTGWDPTIVPVTEDATYTAQFGSKENEYTVTWVNGDGNVIYSQDYTYGQTPVYDEDGHGVPQKTPTAQYTYTFTGWDPTIVPVTKDATYTAQFGSKENEYTVTWVNGDGKVIYSRDYTYGQTPSYNAAVYGTPEKTPTAQYTYTFNGKWDPAIVPVTEDATYTAQFSTKVNEYTVTWIDGNGNILDKESYKYGETPVYDEAENGTPQKTPTAQYTYTFNGKWTPAIVPVTKDATYTAQFDSKENVYTVTWVNGDGNVIYSQDYTYGQTPVYDEDGHGVPQKTPTAQYTYTFNGKWNPTIVPVTKDATYTAQFDSKENEYTVTWVNGDGNVIYSQDYTYGQTPVYDEDGHGVPQKTPTAQYTYTFNGAWDPTIVPVTEDATYTAQFSTKVNEYKVTWVDGNNKEIYTESYEYGEMPAYNTDGYGVPKKDAIAQYTYTFNGTWDPAIVEVTEDATYTAQFDATVNMYTVTWVDGNNDVIYTESYEYGEMPSYDEEAHGTPKKDDTEELTYEFNGTWDPEIVEVTEDATYVAQFDELEVIEDDPTPLDPGPPTEELEDIPEEPVPMTGDSSNMGAYAMILLASIIGMAGAIVLKKKRLN